MKTGPKDCMPPGEQLRNLSCRPTFLRLPAAGAIISSARRVGINAATLRRRQDARLTTVQLSHFR
jgi:hypothetical protein